MPNEADLSEQLGVSRSSLREAVRTLAALGVLEVRHGDGTYVTMLRPGTMLRSFSWAIDLVPMEGMIELLEIRQVLESHAAALAAGRLDDATLAELADLVEQMQQTPSLDSLDEMDDHFHQLINRASGNSALAELADTFRLRTDRITWPTSIPHNFALSVGMLSHEAILKALLRRDAAGAAAAAAAHVQQTATWLREELESDGPLSGPSAR